MLAHPDRNNATCDHLTCAVGDLDQERRADLVIGNFIRGYSNSDVLTIWKNGERRKAAHSGNGSDKGVLPTGQLSRQLPACPKIASFVQSP